MQSVSLAAVLMAFAHSTGGLIAQETPLSTSPPPTAPQNAKANQALRREPPLQLRVEVVIARHQGGRSPTRVPHSFVVAANEDGIDMKMGVEVPVPLTTGGSSTSYQYRSVGTTISCRVRTRGRASYQLELKIQTSSVYAGQGTESTPGSSPVLSDKPLFNTLNVVLNPTLVDGESVQALASSDSVTGDVTTIDVILHVVK